MSSPAQLGPPVIFSGLPLALLFPQFGGDLGALCVLVEHMGVVL